MFLWMPFFDDGPITIILLELKTAKIELKPMLETNLTLKFLKLRADPVYWDALTEVNVAKLLCLYTVASEHGQ